MDKVYIGAAYYPEMWEQSEIDKDIARCQEVGINVLRVGEFAWGKMEPKEGKFDFDWLLYVVDKMHAAGIDIVMCTPTCTPPRWLMNKYPDTRIVAPELIRCDVSSRCHVCKTSKKAREKNGIIVEQMAKVFAGHQGIIGWQIDNEIFPYNDGCFCENCKAEFRKYLKVKFGSVEKLNKAWGMTRWSLEYDSFDDVQPPYPKQWRHPSLRKAWWDFQCDNIKTFVDEQAEILHRYGCKNVGTDMMTNNNLGYYDVNENLDVVQYNHYEPVEYLPYTAFFYDFLRCVKDKPFWVTETQVGWNGSDFAEYGYRPVGACYANTILPVSRGAEMNMYWLFRVHPNGHELAHGALFSTAGRKYRVSDEVKTACSHLYNGSEFFRNTAVKSKIALHYSHTAANIFGSAPMVKDLDYRDMLARKYHAAFRHYNIDVIDTAHDVDKYDVVVSPFLACTEESDLRIRMKKFAENGGTWIVGPMSDIMDCNVTKYIDAPFGFLEDIIGIETKYQKPIGNSVFKAVWHDGTPCDISTCYDAFSYDAADKSIRSLAKYDGGEFGGLSVIVQKQIGKGKIIVVGSVIGKNDILRLVCERPIAEASENVIITDRTDKNGKSIGIVAVETENKSGYIVLDGKYKDAVSGKTFTGKVAINPFDALILIKQ